MAKIRFFWCDTCNVPRIAETECATCGTKPRQVELSPPGDPFPAMDGHLQRAIQAIDTQFGDGAGLVLLPQTKTIVMNKVSSLDAMYEIVVDGYTIGRLRFDIEKRGYTFLLTIEGARRIGSISRQKWVSIHDGVLKYLKDGANLMLPGVQGCDSEIKVDDEVWIIDSDGIVIGTGIARMSGIEMASETKGFAVKIREVSNPFPSVVNAIESTWDDAVKANLQDLFTIEKEAVSFIRRVIENNKSLPVVVGFSGGKDSLATYLVVEKATGESPPLFFMDTGLELPETLEFIHKFAENRKVRIIGERAENRFWESLDVFGPPARDFRWCCKVLKLGPAATSIASELGSETLSFMGQRKMESFQRSIEPRVTENPWVPGQISANPIQNWNALEVWLFTFKEKTDFNPLYTNGYHRIGCYLCPASPLAELESLRQTHPEFHRKWEMKMHEWAEKYGFPDEWYELGFWRWKNLPKGQLEIVNRLGLDITPSRQSPGEKIELNITKGVAPCTKSGFSLEGAFSSGIDLNRISKVMPIFGTTKVSEELGALRTASGENHIALFSSGSVVVRGPNEHTVEHLTDQFVRATRRALLCQACGSCIPQCDQGALYLDNGKIAVYEDKCINCLKCDNWPCPTYLT
ncbi:MAG: phosphoadenosine phosphosulfate reductase family protein [Candidatus Thorarchaeota archaeon]|nr:phosphoadenosine phosphosulfate reductase family protein [Candidatus Thorarchaeota archaeon]